MPKIGETILSMSDLWNTIFSAVGYLPHIMEKQNSLSDYFGKWIKNAEHCLQLYRYMYDCVKINNI